MTWNYTKKTTELFMAAVQGKSGTHLGEIQNPDGLGEHGSIACGDALRFTFRVDRHPTDPLKDRIVEARYLTFGCTSAIASSEALCALVEEGNYTPVEALKITNQDIVKYLGGLPKEKIHCSVMGAEALEAAVFNWAQKRGVDLGALGIDITREEQEEGRVVCTCFGLTEPYLRRKIRELGLRTIEEITGAVKAGGACMSCHHAPGGLQDLLDDIWGRQGTPLRKLPVVPIQGGVPPNQGLSPYQRAKRIERVMEEQIVPRVRELGGEAEIVDIKETLVYCRFPGIEPDQAGTTRMLAEQALKDAVDRRIRVVMV